MIQEVRITNHLGEFITLNLRSPEQSGLFVRYIDGLSPSKAIINIADIASGDGSIYNSARVTSRNIVISLGFLETPTIEDVRQKVYKYFPIKKMVNVEVKSDNRICQTSGYIESNDINIFSKQEGAVISIICPDAYLYSATKNITLLSGMEDMFVFPFSNDSLTQDLIVLSNIMNVREGLISYTGDAGIGITIRIHATGPVTNLRIANLSTTELMSFDDAKLIELLGSSIDAGDDIVISTRKGYKFVTLIRDSVSYDILYALGQYPNWFELQKGDNRFTYLADAGLSNLEFEIENQIAYEGV